LSLTCATFQPGANTLYEQSKLGSHCYEIVSAELSKLKVAANLCSRLHLCS
jgi:hypothetical protein